MTVAFPYEGAGGAMPASFTVLVSSDPQERGRIAAALDGGGVVVMVPDAAVAVALLQRADEVAHAAGRSLTFPADVVPIDGLVVDRTRAEVRWRGRQVVVSHLELEVLACLAGAPGEVWTYERLHEAAWASHYLGDRDSLHSLVKRLRRKLQAAGVAAELLAVRGIGFQLVPAGRVEPDLRLAGGSWAGRTRA